MYVYIWPTPSSRNCNQVFTISCNGFCLLSHLCCLIFTLVWCSETIKCDTFSHHLLSLLNWSSHKKSNSACIIYHKKYSHLLRDTVLIEQNTERTTTTSCFTNSEVEFICISHFSKKTENSKCFTLYKQKPATNYIENTKHYMLSKIFNIIKNNHYQIFN